MTMTQRAQADGGETRVWRGGAKGWRVASLLGGAIAALVTLAFVLIPMAGSVDSELAAAYAITGSVLMIYIAALLLWRAVEIWRVTIRVDANTVQIRSALLPVARTMLPVDGIRAVRVVHVPSPWQGHPLWWLVPDRGAPLIARRGPGLQFELVSGRVVTVSVDEPQRAVAHLQHIGVAIA